MLRAFSRMNLVTYPDIARTALVLSFLGTLVSKPTWLSSCEVARALAHLFNARRFWDLRRELAVSELRKAVEVGWDGLGWKFGAWKSISTKRLDVVDVVGIVCCIFFKLPIQIVWSKLEHLTSKLPGSSFQHSQAGAFVCKSLESTFNERFLQVEMKAVNHFPRIGDAIEVPGIWGVYDQLREGSRRTVDRCISRRRIFWLDFKINHEHVG